MSLRLRLLIALLVVNLGVLIAVQLTTARLQEQRFAEAVERVPRLLSEGVLYQVYREGRVSGAERVRRLLSSQVSRLREYFDDLLITNRLPDADFRGAVQINPLGAVQRDPATFPAAAIRAGMDRAGRTEAVVEAGGGLCVPILSDDGVAAVAWVKPRLSLVPDPLPASAFLYPLLGATVLLGVVSWTLIQRGVLRPLTRLSSAAARVAAGDFGVRVERLAGTSELNVFVDAFNDMAIRVGDQQRVLEQEVARATEEARRGERALVASSRLASMGTLAAGIAHEINNPIGGMQNAVRRLRAREDLGERDIVYLDLVAEGLERVARTARRVLDFSPSSFEARPFGVREAVDGARALIEHRLAPAGSRIRFEAELPDDLPLLLGDPHEFQQVLLNLFLNSLDALESGTDEQAGPGDGSSATIRVSAREVSEGRQLEILVEDDGPGAAPELLERVFDPFFSAKDRPDASGLGMFISHAIITNHGGSIEVDSAPGEGFRTWIRMDCAS